MRRVELELRPKAGIVVPKSDGYSVYGALLSILSDIDAEVAEEVHDSQLGCLHNSGLQGVFGEVDRRHHKRLLAEETYNLTLGISAAGEWKVFDALVRALVLEDRPLEMLDGELRLETFESRNATYRELLENGASAESRIEMEFASPTCIEEAGEVTTMFPHRFVVFQSLKAKWNRNTPEELSLEFDREELLASVIEKPEASSYRTHAVVVNRVESNGNTRNIVRQGFTGICTYGFKDADQQLVDSVAALARFAEYSGVGSAVSRGCGHVNVEVRR